MRLTPPSTLTFTLAVLAIVAGVASHLGYVDDIQRWSFWLTAAGGGLLVLGVTFRKL